MTEFDTSTKISLDRDGHQPVLRFERRFEQSAERLWRALTTSTDLSVCGPPGQQRTSISSPAAESCWPSLERTKEKKAWVLEADPPSVFSFTGQGETLRWTITKQDHGCVVMLTHTVADPHHAPYTAAGYHVCFDQLATLVSAGASSVKRHEMPPPSELVDHYTAGLPPIA